MNDEFLHAEKGVLILKKLKSISSFPLFIPTIELTT